MRLTLAKTLEYLGLPDDAAPGIGPETAFSSVSTDTRLLRPGALFIPIRGARFDGHDYIGQALEKGAAGVLSERECPPGTPAVRVENTAEALKRLAAGYRRSLSLTLVAVTGSSGKTTTKDMAAELLSCRYITGKTRGNLNNEIGLPLTLLSFDESHSAAVAELGMSARGEISALSKIAAPDIGIITNIGSAHIGSLGSRENICRAKLEILDGLAKNGALLINGDDSLLAEAAIGEVRSYRFGIGPGADFRAENLRLLPEGSKFDINYGSGRAETELFMPGEHNVYNALAAFGAGMLAGVGPEEMAEKLKTLRSGGQRQNIYEAGGITLIEDCYNANPDSMAASLRVLAGLGVRGRRLALLGDMLELGHISRAAHEECGGLAAACCDELFVLGAYAEAVKKGARAAGMPEGRIHTPERENCAAELAGRLSPGDALLVKGSRGMRLEEVLERLKSLLGI